MVRLALFRLISVGAGKCGDLFWISMDGPTETCNPQVFVNTFPDMSCVVVAGEFSQPPIPLADIAVERIGAADVCLVDSSELLAFTRDEGLSRRILSKAKDCLPNRV